MAFGSRLTGILIFISIFTYVTLKKLLNFSKPPYYLHLWNRNNCIFPREYVVRNLDRLQYRVYSIYTFEYLEYSFWRSLAHRILDSTATVVTEINQLMTSYLNQAGHLLCWNHRFHVTNSLFSILYHFPKHECIAILILLKIAVSLHVCVRHSVTSDSLWPHGL